MALERLTLRITNPKIKKYLLSKKVETGKSFNEIILNAVLTFIDNEQNKNNNNSDIDNAVNDLKITKLNNDILDIKKLLSDYISSQSTKKDSKKEARKKELLSMLEYGGLSEDETKELAELQKE